MEDRYTDDEFTKPDEYDVWEESGAGHEYGPLEGTRCFLKSYHEVMTSKDHFSSDDYGYFNGGVDDGDVSVWLYRNDDAYVCCVDIDYHVWHWSFSDEDVDQTYYVDVTPDTLCDDTVLKKVVEKILTYIEMEKRLGKDVANLIESYL